VSTVESDAVVVWLKNGKELVPERKRQQRYVTLNILPKLFLLFFTRAFHFFSLCVNFCKKRPNLESLSLFLIFYGFLGIPVIVFILWFL
jgi:hypothetical protein